MKWWVVLKWEARQWFDFFGIFLAILLCLWAVLFLIPVPRESWWNWPEAAARTIILLAGANALFIGVVLMLYYPVSMAFTGIVASAVLEWGNGWSYVYRLLVRTGLGICSYMLGVGIIWVTLFPIGQPFAVLDIPIMRNMLAVEDIHVFWELMFLMAVQIPVTLKLTVLFVLSTVSPSFIPQKLSWLATLLFILSFVIINLSPWLQWVAGLVWIIPMLVVTVVIQNRYAEVSA
ncbi:MAG: hypothetical protein FWC16_10065 [Defluviitaleaceae bacterium]|nr:hypothetical protein [Defluviitaleaceae bacterium]MCL2275260.1 hypothetical protein [Defluviitaleaceae bacterium]